MEPRLLALAIPSAILLIVLVFHSFRALPRARAAWFWTTVVLYGLVRGLGVRWVVEHLGARVPYVVHDARLLFLGVSAQEIAGWAIVSYLAWWLGARVACGRLGGRLLPQVAWGCLVLGATSWAVESTAVAAGWWHWNVPASGGVLGEVPAIGIVDWLFVGADFLLPFLVLTAPSAGPRALALLALAAFPVHFGAHLIPGRPGLLPIPWVHVVHWALLGTLLWVSLRSGIVDRGFEGDSPGLRRLPLLAIGVVLLDLAAVQIWLRRADLLPALLPLALLTAMSFRPMWGVVPLGRRPAGRITATVATVLLAVVACGVHARGARRDAALQRGLDAALAARDRGDLAGAVRELTRLTTEYPAYHAPFALLGEIDYRLDRRSEARAAFRRVVRIQPSNVRAYRYLAVLDLADGNREGAVRASLQGLRIDPADLELRYLRARAHGGSEGDLFREAVEAGPEKAENIAALAYEVGDTEGAARALDGALARWPDRASLLAMRARLRPDRPP